MEPTTEEPRVPRLPFLPGVVRSRKEGRRPRAFARPQRRLFVRSLSVFVSSPGDLSDERKLVQDVVGGLSQTPQLSERISLRVLKWEDGVPPEIGEAPQAAVDKYLGYASSADIVVMLVGGRLGTRLTGPQTGLPSPSGTEYELENAYEAYRRKGSPVLLVYRKDDPAATASAPEEAERVRAFWARFEGPDRHYRGIDPRRFSSAAVLKDHLSRDLSIVIHGIDSGRRTRRRLWIAGIALASIALGWAAHLRYQAHETAAAVDRIVEGAFRREAGDGDFQTAWASVPAELVALGPGAVRPIFDWLGKPEIYASQSQGNDQQLRPDQTPTRSLVTALTDQGTQGREQQSSVCERLFQIPRSYDAALRYPKTTHLIALEEGIARLKCPGTTPVLRDYLAHLTPECFVWPAPFIDDIRKLVESMLARAEAAPCRGEGCPS